MGVDDEFEQAEDAQTGFVAAVLARSMEEAERFRTLMEDHDIPAIIDDATTRDADDDEDVSTLRGQMRQGISVLVPEAMLDEASEIIADIENLSEFDLAEEDLAEDDEDEELEFADGFSPPLSDEADDDEKELFDDLDDLDDDDEDAENL